MTEDDLLDARLAAAAADHRRRVDGLVRAGDGPNLGSPGCPREARWAAVEPLVGSGLPAGWTAAEEEHIGGCSWCRKRVAFLTRDPSAPTATASPKPAVADFVRQELTRLTRPAPLTVEWDRTRRRWLRDQVYQAAVAAAVVVTSADNQRFHQALVAEVRALRRVSGQATVTAAADETARSWAQESVALLDAVFHALEGDPRYEQAADWYRSAEDAALSEEEIAGSDVPVEAVRVAVHKVRALVRAKLRPTA
jgi:hypothetical protein